MLRKPSKLAIFSLALACVGILFWYIISNCCGLYRLIQDSAVLSAATLSLLGAGLFFYQNKRKPSNLAGELVPSIVGG